MLVSTKHQYGSAIGLPVSPPTWTPLHLSPHPTPLGCYRAPHWGPQVKGDIGGNLTQNDDNDRRTLSDLFPSYWVPDTELHSPPKRTEGLLTDKRGWFTLQLKVKVLVTRSCPTSCDPIDCNCSPPASSLLGIFQGRILEWIAIPFSRGSSHPGDCNWVSCIAGGFFIIWAKSQSAQPCACLPSSQSSLLWFKEFCRKRRHR